MVILEGKNFLKASRDHLLVIILIVTAKLANIHSRNISFCVKNSLFQISLLNKVALHSLEIGSGDYCVVNGCSNDRRKQDKATVMDHVGNLRWYGPKYQKDISKLLNREGDFKVSMSTKVWSNHFAAGYRSDECTTPTP